MHRCSFRPTEQSIYLGCFGAFPESSFGLLTFALGFTLGLLGVFDRSPDPFKCDLSIRELLDRLDIRQSVPDRDQPLQRPRSRDRFLFVPAHYRIWSIETVCRDRRHDPVPCEMEWHSVLLLLAIATRAATPFIALRPPQCNCRQLVPNAATRQKSARKGLDSGPLDQPRMWHAQNTQSRSHYPSETEAAEHRHRTLRPSRRWHPDPHLSPHWCPNPFFPGAAPSAWRSSDAD